MELLRSMLFTPGNNLRMIQKTGSLGADAVILDLEDAVPIGEKETGRLFVRDSVEQVAAKGPSVFVRVNALPTGLTAEDLRWAVQPRLKGIVLPKSESKEDVLTCAGWIAELEKEQGIEPGSTVLVPLLETAKGVLLAWEIATASQRVIALAFGAIDFTRDMGTNLSAEGAEIFYARSHVAIAARAAGLQAIDTPWTDITDIEGLVREAKVARQLGFKGKLAIHPNHVESLHRVFSPSEAEIAFARRVVVAFREAEAQGLGAISLDGRMIDVANARQAEQVMAWAEMIDSKRKE